MSANQTEKMRAAIHALQLRVKRLERIAAPVEADNLPRHAAPVLALVRTVAKQYGIPIQEMLGYDKRRWCAWPRQEAMAICMEAGFSTTLIGQVLGGRDHATISHGAKAHKVRMAKATPF